MHNTKDGELDETPVRDDGGEVGGVSGSCRYWNRGNEDYEEKVLENPDIWDGMVRVGWSRRVL